MEFKVFQTPENKTVEVICTSLKKQKADKESYVGFFIIFKISLTRSVFSQVKPGSVRPKWP